MSNLLPKERLDLVWGDYRSRLILTGASVLLGSAILSGSAFLPAYVALKVEENLQQQKGASAALQFDANPQSRMERVDILRSQTLLARIAPIVSATTSPSDIIKSALELRPSGVFVNRVSFEAGKSGSVVLHGVAGGRDGINLYRDALARDGRFTGVSVPVGSLVGSDSGEFIITLSGNF